MIIITKKAHFNAAHRLFNPKYDEKKNRELFGLCSNELGHGHNYVVEVSISGSIDPETGYLVDLSKLGEVIKSVIIDKCDHKNLNQQVDFLSGINPTVENLAEVFYKELRSEIGKITKNKLYSVRVWETEKNYAEYRPE